MAKQTLSKARALCKQEGLTKSAKNSVQSIIYRSLRLRQPELYQAIVNPSWWTRLKAFFGIGLYAKMKLFVDSDVNLLLDKYENIKVLIASKSDLLDAESFFPYINKLLTRSLLGENALHFVTSILEALMSQCDKQEDYKALQRLTGGLINRMLRNAQRQPALMRFFVSKELMLLPWHIEKDPQILVDMLNWPKLSKPMIAKLRGFLGELNDEAYCQTFLKAVIKNPPKQLEHFQDQVFALYEKFDIDMIDSVQTSKTAFMLKHAKQLSQKIPQLCRKIFNKLLPKITDKQLKVHYGDLKNMVHDKSINKTDWQACLDRLHFDTHKQAGTLLKWRESNGCGVDRSKQRQSMVGHRVV